MIADASPHEKGYTYPGIVQNSQIDWREGAKKAAEKGIKFDTVSIFIEQKWYKELSAITNGVYVPFASSQKTARLIEASVLSKVASTRDVFEEAMNSEMLSDDFEMQAVYSAYYKTIVK